MRKVFNLNEGWRFLNGFDKNMLVSASGGEEVSLPHCPRPANPDHYDESAQRGEFTYYRSVTLENIDGKEVRVCFEGIAHSAEIFMNGILVGEHKGGYTGFDVSLTSAARAGVNTLLVRVNSDCRDIPPFGGELPFVAGAGIYREASLVVTDRIYIDRVFADGSQSLSKRELRIRVRLNKAVTASASCKIFDQTTGEEMDYFDFSGFGDFETTRFLKNAELWTLSQPRLYRAEIEVNGEGYSDNAEVIFGFRKAEFTPTGFLLNGKSVDITGINRQQSYPYIGYAAPSLLQKEDARLIKKLGFNFVRTANYPQSRHFLDECDRLGIMVMSEIPGWTFVGTGVWQDVLLTTLTEMITEQYNHPSVVLWSVRVCSSEDNHDLYEKMNARAKELDKTRQTIGVRSIKGSNLIEDVYGYNDYSYGGAGDGIEKPKVVTDAKRQVPYLVTEHNGFLFPVRPDDGSERFLEQALRHLTVVSAANEDKLVCGAVGSCLSDYNTDKGFGSENGMAYYGITDIDRNPKTAAYAYMSQQDETPVLEIGGTLSYGDNDGGIPRPIVVFSNCDEIRFYNHGELIGSFRPSKDYKGLKHPPFIIDNLIKSDIQKTLGVSESDAAKVSRVMLSFMRGTLTSIEKFEIVGLCRKYNKTVPEWTREAKRIISRQGEKDDYEAVGIIKGKEVVRKKIGDKGELRLKAVPAVKNLTLGDSYEIIKVDAVVVSDNGPVGSCRGAVSCEVTGGTVVGESVVALSGGKASFYVKVAKAGTVSVKFDGGRLGKAVTQIEVAGGIPETGLVTDGSAYKAAQVKVDLHEKERV